MTSERLVPTKISGTAIRCGGTDNELCRKMKVPQRGDMRHRGGRTTGNDANGFGNAKSVDEDTLEATIPAPSTTLDRRQGRQGGRWQGSRCRRRRHARRRQRHQQPVVPVRGWRGRCSERRHHSAIPSRAWRRRRQWGWREQQWQQGRHDEGDKNNNEAATSTISSGGRNCEGGDDNADGAPIHRRPVVGNRAGPVEKDIVTCGNKIQNNQLSGWRYCQRYTWGILYMTCWFASICWRDFVTSLDH